MNNTQNTPVCRKCNIFMAQAVACGIGLTVLAAQAELRVEASIPAEKNHGAAAAADGNRETWFQSMRPPRKGEFVAIHLGAPQKLTSITVLKGKQDGSDIFESAMLEVSPDGKTFHPTAPLKNGGSRCRSAARRLSAG